MSCRSACALEVPGYQHMVVSTDDIRAGDFRLMLDFSTKADPRDRTYRQTFAEVEHQGDDVLITFQYPESYWTKRNMPHEDRGPHVVFWRSSLCLRNIFGAPLPMPLRSSSRKTCSSRLLEARTHG